MKQRASTSFISSALGLPIRRPWATIVTAAALVAVSVFCITRFHASGSLESMMDEGDSAALAAARIASRFQTADTLLLVVTAPDSEADATAALLSFARNLRDATADDPALAPLIHRVQYQIDADSDERRFIEKEIVPKGLLYLTDEEFESVRNRLTLDSMRRQIQLNEEMIAAPGPAAEAISRTLLRDPLRLREMLGANLAHRIGASAELSNDGAFISRDGRSLLIRIVGKQPVSDIEFSKLLFSNMHRVAESVNPRGFELEYSGAYAIAAASERAIRADMIRSVCGSIVLMQLLFLLVYRRLVSFPLAIIPTGVGIVIAFGIMSFVTTNLTPVTAVIGAVLAGLGIDYSIHMLSEFQRARAAGSDRNTAALSAARGLLLPIALAAGSSMLGFIAIAQSSVRALREFAWLGALGLFAAMVAALFLLPTLLVLAGNKKSPSPENLDRTSTHPSLQYIILFSERKRALSIIIAVIACVAAALVIVVGRQGSILAVESDLSVMHPQPNPALDLQVEIPERFGGAPDSMIVYLSADSPRELVRDAHQLAQSLDAARTGNSPILGSYGLASYLPDPESLPARHAAIESIDVQQVVADFQLAVQDSLFDSAAFESFILFLKSFLRPGDGPDLATLLHYPDLAASMLPRPSTDGAQPAESLTIVLFNAPLTDHTSREQAITVVRSAIAPIPAATLTGMSVIGHDTQAAVRRDLARQMTFAAIAVIAIILLVFRNVIDTMVTLLPTLFAMFITLASMRLLGDGLNMINLIGLPLLAGIGVDNGIFITSMARRARSAADGAGMMHAHLAAGLQAIVMTSVTTGLAFGSLVFTSVPAIQSLGRLTAVGIVATLAGTILLLLPIHITLIARRRGSTNHP